MDEYTAETTIAQAIFGPVLLCKQRATGRLVAVKQLNLLAMESGKSLVEGRNVQEDNAVERAVYAAFAAHGGHANVLNLLDEFEANGCRHLVLDYCQGGELFDIVVGGATPLNPLRARRYFRHIVHGINFMHTCGFAHRDISLENILVDGTDVAKVIDFGLAAPINARSNDCVGKLFYMAPEVYHGRKYDPAAADMWSLGILLFILHVGSPPVESTSPDDDRFKIIQTQGIRGLIRLWKIEGLFSHDAIALLDALLRVDPVRRMTMAGAMSHPYLAHVEPTDAAKCAPFLHVAASQQQHKRC
ncbi:hypothetical protein LEN26_003718 [Aphanomyces euteiches]|nr:hypothetical protein AeMF1_002553 [Aphanomyces euteiches]KAH9152362.1 hypothetical protein LEN26_003718 [Aphanomyces euteiches]KAH9192092.1 hypothetical protein AeNC1_005933 [Aphanomyces euteiches]